MDAKKLAKSHIAFQVRKEPVLFLKPFADCLPEQVRCCGPQVMLTVSDNWMIL